MAAGQGQQATGEGVTEPHLPTIRSSRSPACGLTRVQMSMVNRVLLLLKMEAKEDMRAASITANIRPRNPAGRDGQDGQGGRPGLAIPGNTTVRPYRSA